MRDYRAEVNATPLDVDLFIELYQIASQAMTGKRRMIPHDSERFVDGKPRGMYLTDVPMNQMGLSIVNECNKRFNARRAKYVGQSFLMRWFEIERLKSDGKLDPFSRPSNDPGTKLFHSSIFHVAAVEPLGEGGHFGDDFFDKVRAIYEAEGGDDNQP